MVKLYVCKICGEPYIGGNAPDDCPFCGAPRTYLKPVEEFSKLWETGLTEQEKKDIEETLKLEINATAYYDDVAKNQEKYSEYNRLYKQLTRVEQEHAELAGKFLNKKFKLEGEKTKGSIEKDLERTKELETDAIAKYQRFLRNAKNTNVKHLFTALIHAEKGHKELVEKEL